MSDLEKKVSRLNRSMFLVSNALKLISQAQTSMVEAMGALEDHDCSEQLLTALNDTSEGNRRTAKHASRSHTILAALLVQVKG